MPINILAQANLDDALGGVGPTATAGAVRDAELTQAVHVNFSRQRSLWRGTRGRDLNRFEYQFHQEVEGGRKEQKGGCGGGRMGKSKSILAISVQMCQFTTTVRHYRACFSTIPK